MILCQVSLNFDPVKEEILKLQCHIYILMKKVIILRKSQCGSEVFLSTILNHRKILKIFTLQLAIYYIQY